MSVPDQSAIPTSARGFHDYTMIKTAEQDIVLLYESSAALAPHVWIAVAEDEVDSYTAHLNVEQAIQLRDALDTFISCIPERWEEGINLLPESERERQRKMRNTTEEVSE